MNNVINIPNSDVLYPNVYKFLSALNDGSAVGVKWDILKKFYGSSSPFSLDTPIVRTHKEQYNLYMKGRLNLDLSLIHLALTLSSTAPDWARYSNRDIYTVLDKKQIVTNAPPMLSYHEWGLASDLLFSGIRWCASESQKQKAKELYIALKGVDKADKGRYAYLSHEVSLHDEVWLLSQLYTISGVVDCAKLYGLTWGGIWTSPDVVHFEYSSISLPPKDVSVYSRSWWNNDNKPLTVSSFLNKSLFYFFMFAVIFFYFIKGGK